MSRSDLESKSESKLKIAIVVTSAILAVELFGSLVSGSLALLSDAGHVFMDVFALTLSFGAIRVAKKPSTQEATFGYHRFEVVAALVNAVTLVVISLLIFHETYKRIISPPEIRSFEMLIVAIIGFGGNLYVALNLRGYEDINLKSAFLHVLGDTLSSVAVIVGALWMIFSRNYLVDPLLSGGIGLVILLGASRLLKESSSILLEKTPKHIDIKKVISKICRLEGVKDIHDIHVWSICSHVHALSAHILVDPLHVKETESIIERIRSLLSRDFRINHTTLQFECSECEEERIHHIKHG